MDLLKLLVFHMSQAIRLVPSVRKDIERYLTADGEREAVVCELLAEDVYKFGSDACFLDK